ncbi:unnamed protein product, partial [Angiostrongylus costaricensis]|uniref:WD_REPEATS_REGION domain-containing protein n=1 Tax=Angiostrongylus costaricensis TaxID=334426 RepID=A0A0R3PBV8_ANGCS
RIKCGYKDCRRFFRITYIPSAVFDVPISATVENLNALVNKAICSANGSWSDKRFELLIGETFVRSSLAEFIEEYSVETETVLKIECILGKETPKPLHDISAPDWISSIAISSSYLFATTYSGDVIIIDSNGKKVLENQRDKGSALKCSVLMHKDIGGFRCLLKYSFVNKLEDTSEPKKLEGHQIVSGGENQILTLYEVESSAMIPKTVFRGHERSVECVDVNKECSRLVSGDQATVFEKDADGDQNPKKRKENFVTKVKFVSCSTERLFRNERNVKQKCQGVSEAEYYYFIHKDAVVGLRWCSWNSSQVISASWDHCIALWDLQLAGEVSRIRGSKSFTSIDVNKKSGLVISSSTDAVPRLYDCRSHDGSLVKQSFIGHTGWVSCVKWSPRDEVCFVSASFDKSMKMWDIRSSKTSLFDLHGHDDRVLCCAWGDGVVASGSADSTIKVFSTP